MTQPQNEPTAAAWDERYESAPQVWSGQPNGALVAEIADLPPGRALDVGCGEGADAIWLAGRGWKVTALDVSGVALQRARAAAKHVGVDIEWIHAGLLEASPSPSAYDLVSAQYPALLLTPDAAAERALLAAVAPKGHLLVVHHVLDDAAVSRAKALGFDPTAYVSPGDVAAALDDDWDIQLDQARNREIAAGAGAHHTHDVVLHARRRPYLVYR